MQVLRVNGKEHRIEADQDAPLLYILRNDLGLNAPKFGCGLGQCGACAVIVGNALEPSCISTLRSVGSAEVTTLEGIGSRDKPHALQLAFIAEQAAQCGYCSNGMIMGAKALLDQNPHPTEDAIKAALDRFLCRCGSHGRVLKAVARAAANM